MSLQSRKRQQNNKGFTLLEVLIAMAILGIIVAPLLYLFVLGAQTNQKARKIMRATTVAENTMEELKSSSLGDVLRTVNGASKDEDGTALKYANILKEAGSSGTADTVFEASCNGTTYTSLDSSTSSVYIKTDADGNETKSFFVKSSATTPSYYIVMENVTDTQTAGHEAYDEVICFQSQGVLNNANIPSMTASDCGYYSMDYNQMSLAAQTFASDPTAMANGQTESSFLTSMTRTITLDITKDTGTGYTTAVETIKYDAGSGTTTSANRYYSPASETLFDNYGSDTELDSLFLYYYPLYNSGATPRDTIIINNTSNVPVNVFLICMPDTAYNTVAMSALYKANLQLKETAVTGAEDFYTSICSNLSDSTFVKTDYNTELILSTSDLGNRSQERIYYNVSITLYKHRASSFTASSGTTTFTPDASDKITVFTGSVLDSSISVNRSDITP